MAIDFAQITEVLKNNNLPLDPEQVYEMLGLSFAAKEFSFAMSIASGAMELGKAVMCEDDWCKIFEAENSLISIMRTAVQGEMGLYLSMLELAECACPHYRYKDNNIS